MYTKCLQNLYKMYTKCIQNVNKMYTKCIQNVYKIYTKCIHDVYKMYTKCVQNVYKMLQNVYKIICLQNVYKMYWTNSSVMDLAVCKTENNCQDVQFKCLMWFTMWVLTAKTAAGKSFYL